jgi:hypothetical protein
LRLANQVQLVFQFLKEGCYLGSNTPGHFALQVERLPPLGGKALPGQDNPDHQQGTDGQTNEGYG